jgi:hypothetical protein
MSWKCQCQVNNADNITRCAMCGKPREIGEMKETDATKTIENLTRALHNAIERLSPDQKMRVWRWLENNII